MDAAVSASKPAADRRAAASLARATSMREGVGEVPCAHGCVWEVAARARAAKRKSRRARFFSGGEFLLCSDGRVRRGSCPQKNPVARLVLARPDPGRRRLEHGNARVAGHPAHLRILQLPLHGRRRGRPPASPTARRTHAPRPLLPPVRSPSRQRAQVMVRTTAPGTGPRSLRAAYTPRDGPCRLQVVGECGWAPPHCPAGAGQPVAVLHRLRRHPPPPPRAGAEAAAAAAAEVEERAPPAQSPPECLMQ